MTSQPQPQQSAQPVFAMPAPPSAATENTALNSSMQQSYTPGTATGNAPLVIFRYTILVLITLCSNEFFSRLLLNYWAVEKNRARKGLDGASVGFFGEISVRNSG